MYVDINLDDQHCITIGEETVLILDSFFICFHYQVVTRKSTCHNQQACFWQMQISDQAIGNAEIKRRVNEQIGPSGFRFQ